MDWRVFERVLEREPMKAQDNSSWCGPACIQEAIKRNTDLDVNQEDLAKIMGTNMENGTAQKDMIKGLDYFGIESEATTVATLDELEKEIKEGNTVIVNWMSGPNKEEDGHYSLLEFLIYANEQSYVVLNDPNWLGSFDIIRRQNFEDCWYDEEEDGEIKNWALIVKKKKKKNK